MHSMLGKFYNACSTFPYILSLLTVPTLGDMPPQLQKAPKEKIQVTVPLTAVFLKRFYKVLKYVLNCLKIMSHVTFISIYLLYINFYIGTTSRVSPPTTATTISPIASR